jgi:hypothetical protein
MQWHQNMYDAIAASHSARPGLLEGLWPKK